MSKTEAVSSSWLRRSELVVALGSVCTAILLINYYIKIPGITQLASYLEEWVIVVMDFGLILGFASIAQRNARNMTKRRGEWWLDSVALLVATVTILSNLIGGRNHPIFTFINVNLRGVGTPTMLSMHGFFCISAALRAFKFKSLQITVALGAMMLIMLYNVPLGEVIWPGIAPVAEWLIDYGFSPGSRALLMTTSVGAIFLGFRVLTGMEREAYGIRREKR